MPVELHESGLIDLVASRTPEPMITVHQPSEVPLVASSGIIPNPIEPTPGPYLASTNPSTTYNIPRNHQLWGNVVTIPFQIATNALTAQYTSLIQTESYDEAVDWHIELGVSSSVNVVVVRLQYSIGQIQFTKYVRLRNGSPRQIHINSRYIQLAAAWWYPSNLINSSVTITCGVSVGGLVDRPQACTFADWIITNPSQATGVLATPTGGAGMGAPYSSIPYVVGGQLQAFQASLSTMTGDSVAYLMFFDEATTPSNSDAPIWVSPAFTAANQWIAFDDTADPQVLFGAGLSYGLSSNQDNYSASSGSGIIQIAAKIGQ